MWAQRDWPGQGGLKGEGAVVFPKNSGCVVEFLGAFCTDAHQYPMKGVLGIVDTNIAIPGETHGGHLNCGNLAPSS